MTGTESTLTIEDPISWMCECTFITSYLSPNCWYCKKPRNSKSKLLFEHDFTNGSLNWPQHKRIKLNTQ